MVPICLAVFSANGFYFATSEGSEIVKTWETASNQFTQSYKISSLCTALSWNEHTNTENDYPQLAVGTDDGCIEIFTSPAAQDSIKFAKVHSDSVNDICWCSETGSLFTCSSDKFIIIWNTTRGEVESKWESSDDAVHSLCVIDKENLLSSGTEILWWSIKEKTVLKKFSGHEMTVTALFPVHSLDSSSNSYFLSAAAGDTKIKAWHLTKKNSENAVASFDLPEILQTLDVTKSFSKDKPMLLSAVTKSNSLLLFKHVLNGRPRRNLKPQVTLQIVQESKKKHAASRIPILSAKVTDCAEFCVIAYGNAENIRFEKIEISKCPKTLTLTRDVSLAPCSSLSKDEKCNDIKVHSLVNGLSSPSADCTSPKKSTSRKKENSDSAELELSKSSITILESKTRSSASAVKMKKKKAEKSSVPEISSKTVQEFNSEKVKLPDAESVVSSLILGVQEDNETLIDTVLICTDSELIRDSVRTLPLSSLKQILHMLLARLKSSNERQQSCSRRWIKEILNNHLTNILAFKDMDIMSELNLIQDHIKKRRVSQMQSALLRLKGLLKHLPIQKELHQSSGSDTDEKMETS